MRVASLQRSDQAYGQAEAMRGGDGSLLTTAEVETVMKSQAPRQDQ
jgi:hypothetical protein